MKWDFVVAGILHIKNLVRIGGWQINLHKITGSDAKHKFHSHPAWAFRIILKGGYFEELPNGELVEMRPGMMGVVKPEFIHRIDAIHPKGSYTLWIRGPVTHNINVYHRVRGGLVRDESYWSDP